MKWTSVKEGLPNPKYGVTYKYTNYMAVYEVNNLIPSIARYETGVDNNGDKWEQWYSPDTEYTVKVTAWMELPEYNRL